MVKFKGSGTASQTTGTVAIGPITVDGGLCSVSLIAKTVAGTITTPTNPKIQYSNDGGTVYVDVPSGSVTVSASSSTAAEVTKLDLVCTHIRVVTAGAFAAGDANLTLFGVER
jgi:hypothetical protein